MDQCNNVYVQSSNSKIEKSATKNETGDILKLSLNIFHAEDTNVSCISLSDILIANVSNSF